MTEVDIVERLRSVIAQCCEKTAKCEVCESCALAVAEIERLRKEIECWKAMKSGVSVRIADLESENAALLKQWNDQDQRNEKRHRGWDAEVIRLRAALEMVRDIAFLCGPGPMGIPQSGFVSKIGNLLGDALKLAEERPCQST